MPPSADQIRLRIASEKPPKPVFTPKDGEPRVLVRDPNMSDLERRLRSRQLPEDINVSRLLTEKEMEFMGWINMDPNVLYEMEVPGDAANPQLRRLPAAMKLDMERLREFGVLDRVIALRKILLDPKFEPLVRELQRKASSSHFKEKGMVYELGCTRQPRSDPSTIQLSALARACDEWQGQQVIDEMFDLSNEILTRAIPDMDNKRREQRWYSKASMTPGPSSNRSLNSIQMNYSSQENESLEDSIGKFGGVHTDMHDDPTLLTVMFSLTNFDDEHCTGRFNLPAQRLSSPLGPCEIFLFSARYWHFATGHGKYTVAKNSPLRFQPSELAHLAELPADWPKQRMNLVVYPNQRLMEPQFSQINAEIWTAGQCIFRGAKEFAEYLMHTFIVHEAEVRGLMAREHGVVNAQFKLPSRPFTQEGEGPAILEEASRICLTDFRKEHQEDKVLHDVFQLAMNCILNQADENDLAAGLEQTAARAMKKMKADFTRGVQHEWAEVTRQPPEYYQMLFRYLDPDTETIKYPSLDLAKNTLKWTGVENPEFEQLKADAKYLNCGSKEGDIEVTWTKSADHVFDPSKDKIVGNPAFNARVQGGSEENFDDEMDWDGRE